MSEKKMKQTVEEKVEKKLQIWIDKEIEKLQNKKQKLLDYYGHDSSRANDRMELIDEDIERLERYSSLAGENQDQRNQIEALQNNITGYRRVLRHAQKVMKENFLDTGGTYKEICDVLADPEYFEKLLILNGGKDLR